MTSKRPAIGLTVASVCALLIGVHATTARAQTCTYDPSNYNSEAAVGSSDTALAQGDLLFSAHICQAGLNSRYGTLGLTYWNTFGFDADEWRNSGFSNYCDWTQPLARSLIAFDILNNSYTPAATSWDDGSGPRVRSAFGYAARGYNDLDDLRAGCVDGGKYALTHTDILDDYIKLYIPFFTNDLVSRAGILFHESVHYRADIDHDCGGIVDRFWTRTQIVYKSCTAGSAGCSCNRNVCTKPVPSPMPESRGLYSTYAYEVDWLYSYWHDANANTNPTMKKWAGYLAQSFAKSKFCDPNTVPAGYKSFPL